MNLFRSTDQENEQRRINRYLSSRYFYSVKSRKEAVKFERNKILKKRIHTLAKLNDELNRCQEIYLNCCVNQIGSAHRLAQLIEKLEQISIPDVKNLQETNLKLQTTNSKKDCPKTNQANSELIEKEQLERSISLLKDKKSLVKVDLKNNDLSFERDLQSIKKIMSSSLSEKSSENIELIYSINEQNIVRNQMSKVSNQNSYELSNLEDQQFSNQNANSVRQIDNQIYSNDEIKKDKKVTKQSAKSSKIQTSKKETIINYLKNSFDTDIEDPFSSSFKEAVNQIDLRRIDEQINDEKFIDKQINDKQINDKKVKDKQTNINRIDSEQMNEVNLNKESKDLELIENKKIELKLIRSLDLNGELFEEDNRNKAANSKSNCSDHISKTSLDYKTDQNLDNDLNKFNPNYNPDSNLNLNLDKCIGKDAIKNKHNELTVRFNEDQIKQTNNETKSKIVTNQDYRKNSVAEQNEETDESSKSCEQYRIDHQIKFQNQENQTKTAKRTISTSTKKYLYDYLDENLSIQTPSLGSLNESLIDLTDDLPDLIISPTISCSSFESISSLSTLISLYDDKTNKCPNCSKKIVEDKKKDIKIRDSKNVKNDYKSTERDIKRDSKKEIKKDTKRDIKKDTEKNAKKDAENLSNLNFETFWADIFKDSYKDKLTDLNYLKRHLTKFKKRGKALSINR